MAAIPRDSLLTMERGQAATNAVETVFRILVVDDEPDINQLIRTHLTTQGHEVDSAFDGEEAIEKLNTSGFDIVFLDLSMPGIDGIGVLDWVLGRELSVAVVIVTAFGSEQAAVDVFRRGVVDYLRKPFTSSEFRAVVNRTAARLLRSRQEAELRTDLDTKHRRMEAEFADTAEMQSDLLPRVAPQTPGFELAARCLPAHDVTGEFYDWQETGPHSITLALADAMGSGMPAALLTASVRAAVRTAVRDSPPAQAIEAVCSVLEADLLRAGSSVALFLAQLDPARRRLLYVDAGYGLGTVLHADGTIERLAGTNLPLGVVRGMQYEAHDLQFRAHDLLILGSHGLHSMLPKLATNPEAVAGVLQPNVPARHVIDRIYATVRARRVANEDATIMVLRCTGS